MNMPKQTAGSAPAAGETLLERAVIKLYDRWRYATMIANCHMAKRWHPPVPLREPPSLHSVKRILRFLEAQ
jgi:hypothetical protein